MFPCLDCSHQNVNPDSSFLDMGTGGPCRFFRYVLARARDWFSRQRAAFHFPAFIARAQWSWPWTWSLWRRETQTPLGSVSLGSHPPDRDRTKARVQWYSVPSPDDIYTFPHRDKRTRPRSLRPPAPLRAPPKAFRSGRDTAPDEFYPLLDAVWARHPAAANGVPWRAIHLDQRRS